MGDVTTAYKFLTHDLRSPHGGTQQWTPGEWVEVAGEIVPCENGIHLCRDASDMLEWFHETLWVAEYDVAEDVRDAIMRLLGLPEGGTAARIESDRGCPDCDGSGWSDEDGVRVTCPSCGIEIETEEPAARIEEGNDG